MNNLKPCPFCGSKAVLAESVNTQTFRVECINSGCYCYNTLVCFSDKNRAIEVWNRRADGVHGRWDDSGRYTFPGGSTAVRCTNCGCALTESEYHLNNWNYYPVCGAKMDGERKDGGDG